jgi:hypothetical protein
MWYSRGTLTASIILPLTLKLISGLDKYNHLPMTSKKKKKHMNGK